MRSILLLIAVLSPALAPVPFPKPGQGKSELERLQGSWLGDGGLEARFDGDRLTYYRNGEMVNVYRVTLNALAAPKAINCKGIGGGAADGRSYLGIYKLEKDKLQLYSRGWGEVRPTTFVPANGYHPLVLKRMKR
jgi:uncharacterized protein (TIGR03067 family)